MEKIKKKRKHRFLKLVLCILILIGTVLYSASFPVTMKLLDESLNRLIIFMGIDFEISLFSEFSMFSKEILRVIEFYFENKTDIKNEFPFVIFSCAASFPAETYEITSGFGQRKDPFSEKWDIHEGIDIALPLGSDIMAAWPGKVFETGFDKVYGNYIIIKHSEDFFTKYCHLSKIIVSEGNFINSEEKIGEAGSTGRSTGSHLHFEVTVDGVKINPMECFEI